MRFTLRQAADKLGVAVGTLRGWIKDNKIKFSTTLGGHYRISEKEVKRLQNISVEYEKPKKGD